MTVLLSKHLEALSCVSLPLDDAISVFRSQLQRLGPVQTTELPDWTTAWQYLTPLLSFTTRYVFVPADPWCVVFCNMANESCYVDALAIARATGCTAVSARFRSHARSFYLAVAGEETRQVLAYRDPTWQFFASGVPQPFEDTSAYTRRSTSLRLTPSLVLDYLYSLTGLRPPIHTKRLARSAVGLERSTTALRVPVKTIPTVIDVTGEPA